MQEYAPNETIPPTHSYAGTDKARQEVGLPGHCKPCAAVGHVAAHPDLGCGDVGCNRSHDEPAPPKLAPTNLDLALELFAAELGDGPPTRPAPQNAHAYADQVMTAAAHHPAPHEMDLELFEQSTRGDVASMRLVERSADAIVDQIMSNPHLSDIVAAASERDRAVARTRRIQRDAAEMLRHRTEATDALTAERDRMAAQLAELTHEFVLNGAPEGDPDHGYCECGRLQADPHHRDAFDGGTS